MLPGSTRRALASGVRRPWLESLRAALLGRWPGRLLLAGVPAKLAVYACRAAGLEPVGWLGVLNGIANAALLVGGLYFLAGAMARAQKRLLWRVRGKLILSYIFIGVVPVLLVVAFFVLAGLLIFLDVGSFMVRRALGDVVEEARFLANTAVVEIAQPRSAIPSGELLDDWASRLGERYPGASLALVKMPGADTQPLAKAAPAGPTSATPATLATPSERARDWFAPLAVGAWKHQTAPTTLPRWVGAGGFAGLLYLPGSAAGDEPGTAFLVVRAVSVGAGPKPAYAVVVDIPVQDTLLARVREETSVKVGGVTLQPAEAPPAGRPASAFESSSESSGKRRLPWFVGIDYVHWASGTPLRARLSIQVNVADVYDKLDAGQAKLTDWTLGSIILIILVVLAVLFLIIEAAALLIGLLLARSITGSIHELFAGTERVRAGFLDHRIQIGSDDQLGELASSFNQMTSSVKVLLKEAEEKKRMEEELRIARAIQMSLLPQGDLDTPGLSITAICLPAREVGGDYYDIFRLDDRRVGLLVADVSGKGTSAALYMAELKGLVLSLSRIHRSPRQLLIDANRIISDHLDSRSFITMTYAVIDLEHRRMTYARAGHTPLIFLRASAPAGDGRLQILAPDGLVLGLKIDGGVLFESLLEEATIDLGHRRPAGLLHRRDQRGDEPRRRLFRRGAARPHRGRARHDVVRGVARVHPGRDRHVRGRRRPARRHDDDSGQDRGHGTVEWGIEDWEEGLPAPTTPLSCSGRSRTSKRASSRGCSKRTGSRRRRRPTCRTPYSR